MFKKFAIAALVAVSCAAKDNTIILTGHRSKSGDKLWDIPIPITNEPSSSSSSQPPTSLPSTISSPEAKRKILQQKLNVIIRKDKAAHDLVNYLHAACFSTFYQDNMLPMLWSQVTTFAF